MYLAMSRLKVLAGKEEAFEAAWKSRETNHDGVKGFRRFELFKGNANEEYSIYIFHSEWNSENDFINWTKSDLFNLNHKNKKIHKKQQKSHKILLLTLTLIKKK